MVQLLQRIPALDQPIAAYPNAGYPKSSDGRLIYQTTPDHFAKAARELVAQGVRLIGGCCGTNPRHIAAMARAIAELKLSRKKAIEWIEKQQAHKFLIAKSVPDV